MSAVKLPATTDPGAELLAGALQQLEIYMRRAMESVLATAKVYGATYREAAFIVAVERVAKAIEQRGIFP